MADMTSGNIINPYLKSLEKIEFVLTYACTGKCKHCSEGDHSNCGEHIDAKAAALAVEKVAGYYPIQTVMTFGGEPLLYPEAVFAIHKAAVKMNIPHRQVITNGYFSKNARRVGEIAYLLAESGVNELLLSVDAFHQESIPLDAVKLFAAQAKKCGIPIRLAPAWLVSASDRNSYNRQTRKILDSFHDMEIPEGEGNVIFPEGNALKYLARYFKEVSPKNPYEEDPCDVRCISFSPDGDVLDGNVYEQDIMEIIKNYTP